MTFTFSNNLIDKLIVCINNKKEKFAHIKWNKKHYCVECVICHEKLDSKKCKYSPEECGWQRIESFYSHKKWICHKCLAHRDFRPFIKEIDENEKNFFIKK